MRYPKCGELNVHMNMKNLAQGFGNPSLQSVLGKAIEGLPYIQQVILENLLSDRVDEDIEKQFLESFLTGQQADHLSQYPTTSVCLRFCLCKIARPEISGHFEAGKGPFEDIPPCSHVTMK